MIIPERSVIYGCINFGTEPKRVGPSPEIPLTLMIVRYKPEYTVVSSGSSDSYEKTKVIIKLIVCIHL